VHVEKEMKNRHRGKDFLTGLHDFKEVKFLKDLTADRLD
jgi:hypothetical protein